MPILDPIAGFKLTAIAIAASGDDGFVHWQMTARHTGRAVGVAGTSRPIDLDGVDHSLLRDGKVVTNTVVFDQWTFARQVGLLPAGGSRSDQLLKRLFNLKGKAFAFISNRKLRGTSDR